jgi:hypothetical protein
MKVDCEPPSAFIFLYRVVQHLPFLRLHVFNFISCCEEFPAEEAAFL